MAEITIAAKSKQYPVYIGEGILQAKIDAFIELLSSYSQVFVITDKNVARLYQTYLDKILAPLSHVSYYVTPSGEEAKTFPVYQDIMTKAIEIGLDRKAVILAFGGGVIGDLAGSIAATYMRGIAFYQIPTTVLAHDSAVGGKVAINHPLGKNMIGNFYQPEAVFYDTAFFKTLPAREMRSGFAELIKHALISDRAFLERLMTSFTSEADFYHADIASFLQEGIQVKAKIVQADETEQDVRAYLNFGHTFGHALEAYGGFGKWLHGEAIIHGMLYALKLSKLKYNLDFDFTRFINWLTKLGYETRISEDIPFEKLLHFMHHDKKTTFDEVNMVLLKDIGDLAITAVTDKQLAENYQRS